MKLFSKLAAFFASFLPGRWKSFIYKVPFLEKFIRTKLNQQLPVDITEVKVAGGLLKGFTLELNLQEEKDYWLGTYEPNLQQAINKYCQSGMVVFDVGANIGYISLILASIVGSEGKVYSFEALPSNISRLEKNISLNHKNSLVEIIHAAVVEKEKEVSFFVHQSGAMGKAAGSIGRDFEYQRQINVPGIGLDSYLEKHSISTPDLIKMDIEGGETLAIQGMKNILSKGKPLLLIEIHSHQALEIVQVNLEKNDYKTFDIDKNHKVIKNLSQYKDKVYILGIPNKKG